MSNSGLFKKKTEPKNEPKTSVELQTNNKDAVDKPSSTFSFKAKKKTENTTKISQNRTKKSGTGKSTVDDEVAGLLGEGVSQTGTDEQLTPEVRIVDAEETDIAESEIVSALEAPTEFAHKKQPDSYNNKILTGIKESLALVADNIDDKQIVGDAIYNLMQQIRTDPTLADMLEPEDYGIMARGLRESYDVVVTVKQEKVKKKTSSAIKVDEVSALLGEITV